MFSAGKKQTVLHPTLSPLTLVVIIAPSGGPGIARVIVPSRS